LACCPCQANNWVLTGTWNGCDNWKCAEYEPEVGVKAILRLLNKGGGYGMREVVISKKARQIDPPIIIEKKKQSRVKEKPLQQVKGVYIKPEDWRSIPEEQIISKKVVDNKLILLLECGPKWKYDLEENK